MAMKDEMFLADAIEIAKAMRDRMTGEERAAIQMLVDEAMRHGRPYSEKDRERIV